MLLGAVGTPCDDSTSEMPEPTQTPSGQHKSTANGLTHCHSRLGDHRHVDDHAIAFADTQARQRSRKDSVVIELVTALS
jgi:hypothetical protein